MLGACAPVLLAGLPSGATEDEIALAETAIGCPLPAVVAGVYRVHNGLGVPAIFDGVGQDAPLLSLQDAVAEHRFKCDMLADASFLEIEPSPGVRAAFWRHAWLPIETFGNGDMLFLDFDPAPGGRHGQVVEWRHEECSFPVRHDSLISYLDSLDPDWLSDLSDRLGRR
jgi:cell wall assembly regulator SMI1